MAAMKLIATGTMIKNKQTKDRIGSFKNGI
jgi:hypothetical protein